MQKHLKHFKMVLGEWFSSLSWRLDLLLHSGRKKNTKEKCSFICILHRNHFAIQQTQTCLKGQRSN